MTKKYSEATHRTIRRPTREVFVGTVGVGGNNPIRIQSMTTSATSDVSATIDQVIRLADYGCEIARVTVQGMKEAKACEEIKNGLIKKGYEIPLVADIHFYPPAALKVCESVDKVRINPGNFADRRATFKVLEYDDASYAKELEKIEEKFAPLVEKCKKLKKAMRIGTNHGSLSDRIMNRFGDTADGMVESAIEYAKICRKQGYHDFMFSMKASNPKVMIQAYRLLVARMYDLGWDYPLHLGVTEAGDGEDGRIKSAMGIGSLLLDGLGDTIRVSLTEDPWHEIDPCKRLVDLAKRYENLSVAPFIENYRTLGNEAVRKVSLPNCVGMHRDGTVMTRASGTDIKKTGFYQTIGFERQNLKLKPTTASVDTIVMDSSLIGESLSSEMREAGLGVINPKTLSEVYKQKKQEKYAIQMSAKDLKKEVIIVDSDSVADWEILKTLDPKVVLFRPEKSYLHVSRHFFEWLRTNHIDVPVILNFRYNCSSDDFIIKASAECGSLFCDGLGDGLLLEGPYEIDFIRRISFGILQSARKRIIKTDFISCPSCGRTLFNLQDVTQRIKKRTGHLRGVKIAIMGCIVNGPGEMADADFGYVGSGPGKIDLYVGKEKVERNIDFSDADDKLVELIKSHDRWMEPS